MGEAKAVRMDLSEPVYVVITPVRDEERFIRDTLDSMIRQCHRPALWIIVDDGSLDQTPAIVKDYASRHAWISLKTTQRDAPRRTGSAEIIAFNYGLTFLKEVAFDYLVKLDADLRFGKDYFHHLLSKFTVNPRLGIASGVYAEQGGKGWVPVSMPDYHAAGACKVLRAACFREIGGFTPDRGWDTVDEIKAMNLGWQTAHFPDLVFYHLKPEGVGMGWLHTTVMHGEIYYRTTGGGFAFFTLKFLRRLLTGKPPLLNGIALLYGYLKTLVARKPLLVTRTEATHYRRLLNSRLWPGRSHPLTLNPVKIR